jgi:hypothetical protein
MSLSLVYARNGRLGGGPRMRAPEAQGIAPAIVAALISVLGGAASSALTNKPASGGISPGGAGDKGYTPTAATFTPGSVPGDVGGNPNAASDAFNARVNNAPGVGGDTLPPRQNFSADQVAAIKDVIPAGAGVVSAGGGAPGGGTDWGKVAENAQLLGAVGTTVGRALSPDMPAGHVTPGRVAGTYDATVPGARERLAMLMRSIYGRG